MLPESVTQFVGRGGEVRVFEVEKGAISRFAEAVDDPNPLFRDEEYARNSRYGSIIAPPGFFGWPAKQPRGAALVGGGAGGGLAAELAKIGYSRLLDGGMEYEFFCPVRAGDTLACSSAIKDIREREGSTGKMVIVRTETTYVNQHGDKVATAIGTAIYR